MADTLENIDDKKPLGPFDPLGWLEEHEKKWPSKWTPGYKPKSKASQPTRQNPPGNPVSAVDRAASYLAKIPTAIEGDKGHNQTFYAACVLIKGFSLSIDEARPLLANWNAGCQPPWDDRDIEYKLQEADDKEDDRPRGYLLAEMPKAKPRHEGRETLTVGENGDPPPLPSGEAGTAQKKGFDRNGEAGFQHEDYEYSDSGKVMINEADEKDEVNNKVMSILRNDPELFKRGEFLVEVLEEWEVDKSIKNPFVKNNINHISLNKLNHIIERNVFFYKMLKVKKNEWEEPEYIKLYVDALPQVVKTIHGWGGYPGFKYLAGISEIPVIRKDGSIFSQNGYDPETHLICRIGSKFPEVPENPTKEDALKAVSRILDLVAEFPFVPIEKDGGKVHKSVWLAALFSVVCRHLLSGGPCPLFMFSATTHGTGKTLLIDMISRIALGQPFDPHPYPTEEPEMQKAMMAIAVDATSCVFFDNIKSGGTMGSPTLDLILTSGAIRGRILGQTKTVSCLVETVFFATGNNISVTGDMLRRVIPCHLRCNMENPQEREGFRIKDMGPYIMDNRHNIIRDVLTVVKTFLKSGSPSHGLVSMDFLMWSSLIRNCVYWITGVDPAKAQRALRGTDQETITKAAFVRGWMELPDSTGDGISAGRALEILDGAPEKYELLRSAMNTYGTSKNGGLMSATSLGMRLKVAQGCNVDGVCIEKVVDSRKIVKWAIRKSEDESSIGRNSEYRESMEYDSGFS